MKKKGMAQAGKTSSGREQTRARILAAALKLLNQGGRDAVTTRAVAQAAGVQPPVIYRLFAHKEGLLSALAEHGFTLYLGQKQAAEPHRDPVEALRSGWDRHIRFGLSHSALYLLMYAEPHAKSSAAAELSFAALHRHMAAIASAGRLRMAEDRAVALFHAAAVGTVLTLLAAPRPEPAFDLSSTARDHMLSAIAIFDPAGSGRSPVAAAAATLDAAIKAETRFSPGEYALLREWLGRMLSE